ncbi:MAG: extracellular solute-binding protein [Chloroflexi bacterium]|nr:extracellular solute-binding protein [Chloroflexota bacterium]
MRKSAWFILPVLMLALVACAPAAAPPPPPAVTPSSPAASPSPEAVRSTAQDDAWARTVAAAKREGRLTMYTFNLPGDPGQKVARAFEDAYGIRLEFVTGLGSQLLERLKSEKAAKKDIADTFDTAVSILIQAKAAGLTEAAGNLPVLAESNVWYSFPRVDVEGHVFAWSVSLSTPFINSKLIKPGEEPRTFKELIEPKWKGKAVVAAPATTPNIIYLYVKRSQLGLDDNWFRRLAANDLKIAPSIRDSIQIVSIGERAIAPELSATVFGDTISKGAPVRALYMEEGLVSSLSSGISIVKNAPHPNAARLFANWVLSNPGQRVYGEAKSLIPVRSDVPQFVPQDAVVKPKKVIDMDLSDQLETARVQRERELDKLFGGQ